MEEGIPTQPSWLSNTDYSK
jgi:hypothetical protein